MTSFPPLLGQHFLTSPRVLKQIIEAAELTARDAVLEIGPGRGFLTRALAERAGRVIAVEKDRALAEALKRQFAGNPRVEVIAADIRDFLGSVTSYWLLVTGFKVIANIPYYLTSRLIRLLLEHEPRPKRIVLMVQREVAERIVAKPPRMNLLALSVQFYGTPELIARVPAAAFQPPPRVESAIIRIRPLPFARHCEGEARSNPALFHQTFFRLIRAGFGQKRKTLLNNLAHGLKTNKGEIAALLEAAGIASSRRAETLSMAEWLKLAHETVRRAKV